MAYEWLANEQAPKMLVEAKAWIGVKELAGRGSNPVIQDWIDEIRKVSPAKAEGMRGYTDDDQPWCGLFMAHLAYHAGYDFPDKPLWAMNWKTFGRKVSEPMLGDVCVFWRITPAGKAGHVGLYVGEDAECYHILGGNQGNQVSIVRMSKDRFEMARRPIFKVGQPSNVRKIFLNPNDGELSLGEA